MSGVYAYDHETRVKRVAGSKPCWTTELSGAWNIGENPNGGYLLGVVLNALAELVEGPDPLTLSAHFLRPGLPGRAGTIHGEVVKQGRQMSSVRGSLVQDGKARVEMLVGFGDLGRVIDDDRALTLAPPSIPDPDACVDRRELTQGVDLEILDRLDVRVDPDLDQAAAGGRAVMAGWIRFADGRPADTRVLPLFADAFAPSLFTRFGRVGWVPTLEMTVQVRRRPAVGWVLAHFECDDLRKGSMVETGSLWDENGELVARSRQLGLLLGE